MTPDEWFSCKRKVRYNRESTARKAAADMMAKVTPRLLEAYPCDYCPGWHIGRPRTGNLRQLRLDFDDEK